MSTFNYPGSSPFSPSSLQNVNLTQVNGAAISLGQQLAAASLPVVLPASQITALTPPTSVTVNQATASALNATIVGTSAAGSGASSGLITVQGNASGTPIPVSGSFTLTPSGTQNVNLTQVNGSAFALGQQLAASSLPVVLTAAQLSTLTPLSAVSLNAGANVIGSISNTSFAATQATASALNATIIGTSAAGSGSASGLVTVQGNASGTPIPVSGTVTITPSGTQSVNVSQVGGSSFALGQQLAASSLPVVLTAAQLSTLTPLSTVASTQSGIWNVGLNAGSNAIGSITNTSFAATQATASALNATIVGTTAAGAGSATGLVTVQGNASGTPLPVSGTVTITPSGTQSVNLSQVGGSSFALGQQLAASSLPVVLTAAQLTTLTPLSTIAATQSGTWNINNVSGTVSLPTGAATAANQTNASQKTQVVDGSGNVIGSTANALNVYFSGGGISFSNGQVSLLNSSSTPLGANGVFTGSSLDVTSFSAVTVNLAVDQSGTLSFQFSKTGTNWDELENQAVVITTPGTVQGFFWSIAAESQYYRIVYTNGATAQGTFRLQTILKTFPPIGDVTALSQTPLLANNALTTKTVIYGLTTGIGSGYVPAKVTPSGSLTVALGDISGVVGQQTMAASLPVAIASDQSAIPVTQSGTWNLNNITGTISLPTGAATSANLTGGGQKSQIVDGSGNVIGSTSNALNVNVSSGSVTVIPSGTQSVNLSQVGGSSFALGQQLAASSLPVVLTAAQLSTLTPLSTVTVTQSTAANLNATVTGTVAATQSGTWNINNVSGTVSLPTGASTSANQTNGSQKSQIVDGSGNVIASTSNALNVNVSSGTVAATQSGTWTVQPGNTANTTPWLVKGNDSTNSWSIKAASTAAVATDTALVVAISPNNAVSVNAFNGRSKANAPVVTSYSSTNVTSSAYVQIVASTTSTVNMVEIFDSSGVALYFATGGAGSEVNQFVIYPGGNGQVQFAIAAGTRLSLKAVSTSATSGTGIINLYS